MEVFLDKMQQVLPVLGVEVFVPTVQKDASIDTKKRLVCKIKSLTAQGYLTPNGIVVLAGSHAVLKERASAKNYPSVLNHRNELIKNGHLLEEGDHYVFQKDIEFTSPSAAVTVIHGGSANGLLAWKTSDGKSLKDMELD